MQTALEVAKTRISHFCYFVANMLKMSILKKEKINKLARKSFSYVLKPFKPAIEKLDIYYSQLINYEETLKV